MTDRAVVFTATHFVDVLLLMPLDMEGPLIVDRELHCADCSQPFVFSLGEQYFYQERDFADSELRPSCRRAKRARVENA
jgi:hypothetical protein